MPPQSPSEALTDGIRVTVASRYLEDESNPTEDQYVFGYRITIRNEGDRPAQLLSRHWVIIDGDGDREEIRGPGVVGHSPRLEPGQSFEYESFCPLSTPWGTMEGTYTMRRDDGTTFVARIERFILAMPVPAAP